MTLELWNGYTLQMKGADDESSTKFAKLFCSTWDSLPAGFRQIVTLYWNTSGDSPTFCFEPFVFESGRIVSGRVKDQDRHATYYLLISGGVYGPVDTLCIRPWCFDGGVF